MIGLASLSTLRMIGASASSGSRPMTRLTESRTSLVALSTSLSTSNSSRTLDRPSWLVERRVRMPATPDTPSSMIWVIWLSITWADAPS